MENKDCMSSTILCSPEELPPLFKYRTCKAVTGFESFDTTPSPQMDHTSGKGAEATNVHNPVGVVSMLSPNSTVHANESHQSYSISISLPASPSIFQLEQDKRVLFDDKAEINGIDGQSNHRMDSNTVNSQPLKKAKFHSQPIGGVSHVRSATEGSAIDSVYIRQLLSRNDKLMNKHFDSSKTWFGELEWQILNLQGKPQVPEDVNGPQITGPEAVPALHRYFDALEGPELETLKVHNLLAILQFMAGLASFPRIIVLLFLPMHVFGKFGIIPQNCSFVPAFAFFGQNHRQEHRNLEERRQTPPKASEELALPGDKKWPFLLRFPISSFGMCLGISSQAILWKAFATSPLTPTRFLHASATINLALWCISLVLTGVVSLIYSLKVILYFEAVWREYFHPIRVNFFFAPWITFLFLSISVPPSIAVHLHHALWYVLMAPILCLELKLYGQWMSGGQRSLSKVANPSNHLSVVGNFVGALLGASMGLKEGPIFFFAVGLAHYTVLFVTLYQRLPTNETLPKELHPVFFLFVAAPSVACVAWEKITGDFGYGSRIAYFIALFLYTSLAVRINFFRGFRFSLAWWAYTFPMTGASIATIRYTTKVNNILTQSLSIALSTISTITVTALLISTVVHAFVLRDLFPNDVSIAITKTKTRPSKRHRRQGMSSLDTHDIEACASAKTSLVLEAMLLDARLSHMIAKKPVFRT